MYDVSINHPFSMLVVGPSGSGKTYFVTQLLSNCKQMIENCPDVVKWYYGAWQQAYVGMDYEFYEGCPDGSDSDCVVVVDDLMCEAQEQVSKIFTKQRHHNNVTCIFLCQNLFPKGPHSRNISLNANYLVLMKNNRDKAQIQHLARQMYPGQSKFLIESYEDATRSPFSYLLLDFMPTTDDAVRVRTNVFPGQQATVYIRRT